MDGMCRVRGVPENGVYKGSRERGIQTYGT